MDFLAISVTVLGTGIDLAAALHMDPRENGAGAVQETEENYIGLRDQDQRAEQEGMTILPSENKIDQIMYTFLCILLPCCLQ